MNDRIVEMTGVFKAKVLFPNLPKEPSLELDFEPIINHFQLHKLDKFVLVHWQSRPKGIRGFGCYDWATNRYYCTDWDKVNIGKSNSKLLQIGDDNPTPPTAVILFQNVRILKSNDEYVLR